MFQIRGDINEYFAPMVNLICLESNLYASENAIYSLAVGALVYVVIGHENQTRLTCCNSYARRVLFTLLKFGSRN